MLFDFECKRTEKYSSRQVFALEIILFNSVLTNSFLALTNTNFFKVKPVLVKYIYSYINF